MKFAYVRVSTKEQNIGRQIEALTSYDSELQFENIFIDQESGKDFNRNQYQLMKKVLRNGDTLIIKELDRLGRNKALIKNELQEFHSKGVHIRILNIPTTLTETPYGQEWILDMVNNILIEVLSAIAEEERITVKNRQAEGIQIAKRNGKYKGRKNGTRNIDVKAFTKVYQQVKANKITVAQAVILLGYKSRSSFYNAKKYYIDTDN